MKLTVKEAVPTPPPPKRVILDLSEGEADFIRMVMFHYQLHSGLRECPAMIDAALRLEKSLVDFVDKKKYPYTGYFEKEV
jgi:hypothetical protein